MWDEYVKSAFPVTEEEFEEAMIDMGVEWQFPFAFSALDGSHIPMRCPPGGAEARKQYHNFKNFYSIILMALVDAKYRFIWTACGSPGNTHDSTVFQGTNLWHNILEGGVIPKKAQVVDGVEVPPIILGDGAFPLKTWLMKPFGDLHLTEERRNFNYRLSRARMVTEGAFGKLKGRWRVLHRKNEASKNVCKKVTLACIVLHNLCISTGDTVGRKYDLSLDNHQNKRSTRVDVRERMLMINSQRRTWSEERQSQAVEVRRALTTKFSGERRPGNRR